MGTVDIVTKEYMRENAIFADAFNYLIYGGKKVIDPDLQRLTLLHRQWVKKMHCKNTVMF